MPPSKPACQILATTYKLIGEVSEKLSDIGNTILRLVTLRSQIRFGLIDIVDALGAEVISTVGAISSQVAESVLGSISKMAAAIMDGVFSQILKILLAFPTSVFSLVAIPHDAAKKSVRREDLYLRRANKSIKIILFIILKWTKGKSGSDFYTQMKDALPYIIRAINLCKDLIQGLNGEPSKPGEFDVNSVFKEGVYKKLKGNLNTAINITKPESLIERRTQINKRLESDKNKRYNVKASVINKEYARRRKLESEWYRTEVSKVLPRSSESAPNRLSDAIKEQKVGFEYNQRLELLKTWRVEQLESANIEAEYEALKNKDTWIKAITDTGEQFMSDMRTLEDELFNMLENIKNAYVQNRESQLHCNNIYNMRSIITALVKEMISYMRSFGNAAGETLALAVGSAQSLIEVAEDTFTTATDPGFDYSASELAGSLSIGHGTLLAADAILDSAVTDKLTELINSDDILQAENDQFDEFIQELALIPDWDGRTNVWSVNMVNSSISPYIQLIADITEMLTKVPILSVRNRDSDKRRVQSLIKSVTKDFRVLSRHNSLVGNTLSSYTPYMGSEVGDLMRILSNSGLLKTFATTMSIASLVADITANFTDQFGDEFPNFENCSADGAYPELFTGDLALKGLTNYNLNMQDPKLQNGTQAKWEENSNDRRIPELRDELRFTDYTKQDDGDERNTLGYIEEDSGLRSG